jgi:hypothetical protein
MDGEQQIVDALNTLPQEYVATMCCDFKHENTLQEQLAFAYVNILKL